ncbi:MAG: hypothetical protein HYU73_29180, partial [Betaproteobacteria bacterium]|nr:hypothetical protein [Betaproteobacteria bacterium]
AENPNMLIVHPSIPARTVAELIQLARQRPGKLTYGSGGNGSTQHLAAERFKSMAQVSILHVPYKGPPDAVNALLGGEIELMFPPIVNAISFMKAGKLRAHRRSLSDLVPAQK